MVSRLHAGTCVLLCRPLSCADNFFRLISVLQNLFQAFLSIGSGETSFKYSVNMLLTCSL